MFGVHVCRSGFGGLAMDSAVDEELTMLECMYERIKVVEAEVSQAFEDGARHKAEL